MKVNFIHHILLSSIIIFLFIACGGGASKESATSSANTNNSSSRDITNVILTNRSSDCEDYINNYISSAKDIQEDTSYTGTLNIELSNGKCNFSSNSIPNHDFNDSSAHFATQVRPNTLNYSISANPSFANNSTPLELGENAIMLNGIVLDILLAGCYGGW